MRQAVDLLDRMHAQGLVGTPQLYNGVLAACQGSGNWQDALEVFLGMQVRRCV